MRAAIDDLVGLVIAVVLLGAAFGGCLVCHREDYLRCIPVCAPHPPEATQWSKTECACDTRREFRKVAP